jgi:hypothetical protein
MPYSPEHAFYYVHIPKTAGRAITRSMKDAGLQLQLSGPGIWDILVEEPRHAEILRDIRQRFPIATMATYPLDHLPALVARRLLGEEVWRQTFKFAVVRNPWDLVVSMYHYQRERSNRTGVRIDDHVEWISRCDGFSQYVEVYPVLYSDMTSMIADENGHTIVDFVGKFESLARDFLYICEQIGLTLSLPKVGESDHRPYREYYGARTREIVARHFERDIEIFKYRF